MDTTYNSLVDDCSVENSVEKYWENKYKELELKEKKRIEEWNSKITLFGKKEVQWLIEDNNNDNNDNIDKNTINTTINDTKNKGKRHFILYDGKKYEREDFLKEYFADYKKYPYKVQFNTDNVFYLGGNQRARLQYHILEWYILEQGNSLVFVSDDDKRSLEMLACRHDGETAQRWYNRMQWKNGHEYMMSFGASLEVKMYNENGKNKKSNIKSVWCYRVDMDSYSDKAIYKGEYMTWEKWLNGVISFIEFQRDVLKRTNKYLKIDDRECISSLFYQKEIYLTLPKTERNELLSWLNRCIKVISNRTDYLSSEHIKMLIADLPSEYTGEMPRPDLQFTIDFRNDIAIVDNVLLKKNMSEYDRENNKENNKIKGKNKVENGSFSRVVGDVWTTAELKEQGFNDKNILRFFNYGLTERIGKNGNMFIYRRVSK